MTAKELISLLSEYPEDTEVICYYDGRMGEIDIYRVAEFVPAYVYDGERRFHPRLYLEG